jgi:hypothetical protein
MLFPGRRVFGEVSRDGENIKMGAEASKSLRLFPSETGKG